jgi:hypothetical protein
VSEHDLGGGLANQPGDDPALSRALRERLGRYAASPRLRAAVRESLEPPPSPRRWSGWLAPALTAATTALVMVGWLAGTLPTSVGGDPLRDLARAVITEHARTLSWSPAEPNVIPAALPRAMDESGVTLNWVFAGDNELQLINAHPTYVESHRGLSLVYQDAQGHAVTYVIFPGAATVAMPNRASDRAVATRHPEGERLQPDHVEAAGTLLRARGRSGLGRRPRPPEAALHQGTLGDRPRVLAAVGAARPRVDPVALHHEGQDRQ